MPLIEMPKFNKWLSSLLRNKEKLEEIAITTVNAECSAIIMNKVPEKLEDPGKFLIPCALQELDRTSALADSGASINLLPHSIYKQLGLEALTPTRMTLELANRSITHPMGIAEDVVVRVDGFTFLADFVVVNFEPDPRVPIILGRPFLRTAKALIDLYEETLTLRVGKEELVYYADKSEKNKDKHFVIIDSPYEHKIRRLGKMEKKSIHIIREKRDEMGRVCVLERKTHTHTFTKVSFTPPWKYGGGTIVVCNETGLTSPQFHAACLEKVLHRPPFGEDS
ncbi:reverse transcriptase domain-containing protein [Tanacetum coccineum]|uniref:Reverse transcriptase domain-containing protein n=1 Tax=Tanacetum coccineum TaxID=301880 RepID=A0ABQ5IB35_9ASTR